MGADEKKPNFTTTTIKALNKKRFTLVHDVALLNLMKTVGRETKFTAKVTQEAAVNLDGVFLLPTNNIVEIYQENGQAVRGYLFNNLDVWLTYTTPTGSEEQAS